MIAQHVQREAVTSGVLDTSRAELRWRILVVELVGFAMLFLFLWLDEILDIPSRLFGYPPTPVNIAESIIETTVTAVLAVLVISITWRFMRRLQRATVDRNKLSSIRQHEAELAHTLRVTTMGEIACGLAHELNQPLTAIANDLATCARVVRSPQIESTKLLPLLERAGAEALRAGDIVHHLRKFLEKGQPSLEATDLGSLVGNVIDLLRHEIDEHQVTLQLQLGSEKLPIYVDAIEIEQVIVNLIRNAIDAMRNVREGSKVLAIEATRTDDGMAELAVRDTGEGISEEVAERMFDPFFTTRAGGLGMGLAISRSILEAHHGRLWVAPQDGGTGATVRFALPLHRQAPHDS